MTHPVWCAGISPTGEPRTRVDVRGSARGLNCHSEDHTGLTRRGLERAVASPGLARAPRNTCLTNLSLNSSVSGEDGVHEKSAVKLRDF